MSEPTLEQLVTEAKALAGIKSCVDGHDWKHIGGRNCGCDEHAGCSVPVYECATCRDCDYGDNEEAEEIIRRCREDDLS